MVSWLDANHMDQIDREQERRVARAEFLRHHPEYRDGRPPSEWPSMPAHRADRMYRTDTGIVIGSAYTPTAPRAGHGMEAVQRALLTPIPTTEPSLLRRMLRRFGI